MVYRKGIVMYRSVRLCSYYLESQLVLLSFAAVAPTNQPMFSGKINPDRVIYLTSPKEANEVHIRACFNKNSGHQNLKKSPRSLTI